MADKEETSEEILPSKELLGLDRLKVQLEHVFLDPNNPRFGLERHIEDKRIREQDIQKKMAERIEEVGIDDLTSTMSRFGFSPTDPIVVRKIDTADYVVIEGNRRATAMKSLVASHKSGDTVLDKEILASMTSFEALVYKGTDPDIAWVIQGLRHMSGIVDWPPLQQATFLTKIEQRLKKRAKKKGHPPGIPTVARTASVTPGVAKNLIWSYHAYKQAKDDEEYGDKLDQRRFSMFSEVIFTKKPIEKWLEWDEEKRRFNNVDNLHTFLSWIVPETSESEPQIVAALDARKYLPQILENKDLRQKFIDGEITFNEAIAKLSQEESKEKQVDLGVVEEALKEAKTSIDAVPVVPIRKENRTGDFLKLLEEIKDSIDTLIKSLS